MNNIYDPQKHVAFLDAIRNKIPAIFRGITLGLSSLTFLITCIFLLSSSDSYGQRLSKEEQFAAITEPGSELEFFTIRKDLNISKDEFVRSYLHTLNLTENSEMRMVRTHTNDIGVTSTLYQQYLNGYKVKGAEMMVNERDGRVKYVNGRYLQQAPLHSSVNITAAAALEKSLQQVKSTDYLWYYPEAEAAYKKFKNDTNASYQPKGELMYVSSSRDMRELKDFRLVWHYKVHVNPQIESYEFFIDASTGEIINKLPLTLDCDAGTSTTLWNGAQTIYTQLNAGTYRTLGDCNSAQIHTYNGNGNDNGVGATYYTDANNAWPNTALGNYIAQTHWGSKETRDYYFSIHGRNGYDDAGADYISYINPGYTGNAYWTGAGTSFGGSSTGTDPYVTLDVSGHEHTHGMIDFTSNLTYSYESGALNESFADCLGEAVEAYALGGTPDWIHRMEIGGGNRSFINPNAKGDPDTYLGTNWYVGAADAGGVHTNSGVQNFWFYNLSEGGSGTNDNGNTYNVSGIGINKARLITFDCMVGLISSSQYTNARSVSIQKAKDRYGDCANEVVQTTNAWRAVGVGAAYIAPLPLTITVSTTATYVCSGDPVTLTAFGATSYTWDPGTSTGSPVTFNPTSTTTYTVTGTNAEQCTGTKTVTVKVNELPTVTPTVNDNELCPGQSTTLSAGTNGTLNSLLTTLAGGNGLSGNAFDIHAYNNITITDFKMNIISGDSAEVWYNPGGYGNADITSNTGWSKLGATVPITPAGTGNLTTIPTTSNLTIGAGSTYGIIILCNGSNVYTNGTLVGSVEASNSDLYITEGHGGNGGFGATLNFTLAPRIFNGEVVYRTNYTNYLWSPAATLSSATSSVPTATPASSTQYTLTATDGNGCTGTGLAKVYVYQNPSSGSITATPSTICAGGTSQLNNFPFLSSSSQSLFTTLIGGNGNAANMFDVHAINNITITNVRMNISTGDSAQVWYKTSPYGNANVSSSLGWTKLGNTVAITPAGAGALTLIPTSANLVIPAGSTYGIAVICNGSNNYTNGTTVGAVAYSSPDLEITEGHGGTGFNGAFNFVNFPRVFNGQIDYSVTNNPMSYSWTPSSTLSSSSISNPVADPRTTTTYTMTLTDAHGCKDTAYRLVNVNPISNLLASVSPTTICPGDSAQLNIVNYIGEKDSLFTTLASDNSNGGNAFNIITTKPTFIKSFKLNLSAGATQVEAWYKPGGYGNASFAGTTGWTKIGSTVTVVAAGVDNLTNVPLTTTLAIPAGATYGLMLVSNGTVNYSNTATAVGTVIAGNADVSITVGHGGTGIGAYNFAAFPRIWNGEVVYEVDNSLASFVWTPNTNMNNAFIANPKVAPLSNTIYSVTTTDVNGCTATASIGVNVSPLPQLGTATATPASLCLGNNVSLNYTQPAGSGCFGAFQSGFAGTYAPSNWTQTLVNSNGTVSTGLAPAEITLTSSNGLSGSGQTNYTITVPCSGIVTFDWEYYSTDVGPQYDQPRYSINGGTAVVFPTFKGQNGDPIQQVGSVSIAMTAGQTLTFQAHSSDNIGGSASIKIENFKAPYQTLAGQSVVWFSAPSGGSNLGNGNPQSHTPATASNFIYYAQVSSSVTGCTNTNRSATNLVIVNALPNVTVSATQTTICATSSTTLTAANASSYSWQPGGLTGNSVVVTPATTTTYTVTGTGANGCTKTATITIIVNPQPVITGSASPGIVCPGGPVTLTGTTAGVTWNWQPGNLNGTPVIVNPLVQTTYTVTATSAAGCTKTQTFVILMHPTPTVTTSVAPSATFCAGGNATITANSATATGYTWQPGGGVGANLIVTLANTYTVTATNAQGCTGTATRVITVNSLPTVGITTSVNPVCAGSSTTLTGTGAVSYVWNPGALSGTSVVVSPVSATTYTVIGTNANGCTNTSTVTIGIASLPSVSITPAAAITLCAGQSTALTGNGGLTYSWNPGGLTGTVVNVSPLATTTYTVVGTNANGCNSSSTKLVTVNPLPSVGTTVTPASASICAGSSATITGTGANTYTWQPGALSGASIIVTLANTYTVTGTNTSTGCTKTATRTITVNSLPTVGTTVTSSTICAGTSTTLTGTGASTYTWNPGALSGTSVNVSPAITTTYTVTGTNAAGCTATSTRTITVTSCGSVLNIKLYIEGYYAGAGTMVPVMSAQGIAGATPSQTDTITVELRNTTPPYTLVQSVKTILNTNGTAVCNFPVTGTYYLVVKHRNAVQTWSANPIVLSAAPLTYDFSNAINKAYGSNQQPLGGGVFGFFSGDVNGDENVDLLDLGILEFDITSFAFGYFATDNNGDGNVDLLDSPMEEANINNFVFSNHP